MIKYKLDEDGEIDVSLCKSCNCMTKSIQEGKTFRCGKCGKTK